MALIPPNLQETVDILRKTRDTRNTFTTVADDITVHIQPAGGGLRFGDMAFIRQNLYRALVETANTSIKQGDIVRRTGNNDLAILRIDTLDGIQELTLSEVSKPA